jgi:hypothetical protein
MFKRSNVASLAITFVLFAGLPTRADAEAGAATTAAKSALKSKAAIKFADLLAGYVLGKSLDSIYASATRPDPLELDRALREFQNQHPEYSMMLGTLRRAVSTDGSAITRPEFERVAQDLIFQMDHSLLNAMPATSLGLAAQEMGRNRPGSLSAPGISTGLLQGRLAGPLQLGLAGHRSNLPLLPSNYDSLLAAKIVGAWSFSHPSNAGSGADVYIFHRDGKIAEYKVFGGEEVFSFHGTYTVDGNKLSIRWELPNGLADLLSATIEELDGIHIKYSADKGPFELNEPAAKTLTRISDVGQFSVVTISNPTSFNLNFQIRWASMDGYLTPWAEVQSDPGSVWSIPQKGGFFCEVSFDASFEDGRQEKTYELPFNVVTSRSDPKLLEEGGYRIRVDNGKVDLASEKLSAAQPSPGVR